MSGIELLKLQVEMGADEAIEDTPQNHFENKESVMKAETTKIEPTKAKPKKSRNKGEALPATIEAREIASQCNTLEELRIAVENFEGCAIRKTATNTVFSDGNPKAKIILVGEAPGANEDVQGIPFCGASGKLLDDMFSRIGLNRKEHLYITNTIFWRPPGNRRPTPDELAMCRPFVERHIALMNPDILVLVGGTATAALLDSKTGITKLRGIEHEYSNEYLDKPVTTFAIFHPSFLMRQGGQKRLAWQDLLQMQTYLENK